MKKLMVLIALVAAAVSANAASYAWTASSGRLFDGLGSASANRYSGTGYLFDADTVSQASVIDALAADSLKDLLGKAISSNTFTGGRASDDSEIFDSDSETFYFVVTGADKDGNSAVYVSSVAEVQLSDVGKSYVLFGNQNDYSSAFQSGTSYAGAGWYAASVPEPTSGLLMFLGLAGLALKRKRA